MQLSGPAHSPWQPKRYNQIVDNLYYVKLKFSNLLTSDYIRPAAVSICKFCNVYVRLRAASDFQQDSRCLQNNGMAACKSFSP